MDATPLSDFQNEIYLNGMAGGPPPYPTDLTRLKEAAGAVLTPEAFGYVAGGAGAESTARANREAFDRWRIVPRMLTDVSNRDFATTVLDTSLPAPVLLAPVGVLSIVHEEGELAVARAARSAGVPMILSSVSSYAMEEVAAESGPRWFQLYWPEDDEVAASLLRRAGQAGYETLVVTLDTKQLAWRPRDLDRAYLPFLRGLGLANYLSDPAFRAGLTTDDPGEAILRWVGMFSRPRLTWDDLPFLRRHWDGPILLKGIQSAEDARRARTAGVDGVVVSNHGGRQVDGAIASLDALPAIAEAVGDRVPVLFDSGIRSGADVVKALALGARAVLLGRPYVYGLGLGGEDGVRHVLRCLLAEFELTMRMAGYAALGELGRSAVTSRP